MKAAQSIGLEPHIVSRLINNMHKALPLWQQLIQRSFLSDELKRQYEQLIVLRLARL